jgi:dienelactone hydrolase
MGVGIVGFNWKGVGHSEGETLEGSSMVEDGKRMVQTLLDQGVAPENICIYGHSLGGGVGVKVARELQEEGHEVGFISDRSFADSLDVVRTHLDVIPGLKQAVSFLTRLWWNLEAAEDFVALEGFKGIIYSQEDAVIPYHTSSLYRRVKFLTGEKPVYRMRIYHNDGLGAHIVPVPPHVLKNLLQPFLDANYLSSKHNITDTINPKKDFTVAKAIFFGGVVIAYGIGLLFFIPITITIVAISIIKGRSLQEWIARYIMLPAMNSPMHLDNSLIYKPEGVVEPQKWMVFLNGRQEECIEYANQMQIGVLTANWKGDTRNHESMVEDGEAMVRSLLDQGVSPQNICVYGRSLAANIAVKVAKRQNTACVADRGIKSIKDVVNNFCALRWIPGMSSLLSYIEQSGWNVEAAEDFREIEEFKALVYTKEDGIVSHKKASLYQAVKNLSAIPEHTLQLHFSVPKSSGYWEKIKTCLRAHSAPLASRELQRLLTPWLQQNVLVEV